MPWREIWTWMLLGAFAGAGVCARAQSVVPASVNDALVEMAGRAGVIFVGTVLTVERRDVAGYVDVRFRVEDGIAGCRTGGVYALREWAGLWMGAPRFGVGQRLLVMLRARGPGGMSSPVDGMAGVIPVRGAGLPASKSALDEGVAASEPVADLRWIAARVVRPAGAASVPGVHAEALTSVQAGGWVGLVRGMGSAQPGLGPVVGMLRSAVRDAGR